MPAVSPAMVAIAAAVLVTFIGGLYFITHHKKEESETLQSQKVTGNGLPPKPEAKLCSNYSTFHNRLPQSSVIAM